MESNKNNWTLGEIATLPRQEKPLKQSGSTTYVHYITSRYVCIREATDSQRGILVKVLGKFYSDQVGIVNGEPFSKDDRDELFVGHRYYSFPFPSAKDVKEVLDIIDEHGRLNEKAQILVGEDRFVARKNIVKNDIFNKVFCKNINIV